MRLGKVMFDLSYVVDLDNEEMVEHAKEAIREDLAGGIRWGFEGYIKIQHDLYDIFKESDIPDFLRDDEDDTYESEVY